MTTTSLVNTGLRIDTVADKGLVVVTTEAREPGHIVVVGVPTRVVPYRTSHSFQVDWNTHVDLTSPACHISHSCDPNTGIRDNDHGGFDFVALHDIGPGEELTWDYETSEYVSIAVPQCLCESANCRKTVRGFRHRHSDPNWQPTHIASYLRGETTVHTPAATPRATSATVANGPVTGRCHADAERQ